MEFLINLGSNLFYSTVAGILATLIVPGVRQYWRELFGNRQIPSEYAATEELPLFDARDRAQRREDTKFIIWYLSCNVLSCYLLYAAMILPPMIASLGAKVIRLSDAKFIGGYMPDYIIGNGFFQLPFMMATIAMYLICWVIVIGLYRLLFPVFNYFYHVDRYREVRIKLALFALLSAGTSVMSTWLFVQPTLKDSLLSFAMFGFLGFILANARRGQA